MNHCTGIPPEDRWLWIEEAQARLFVVHFNDREGRRDSGLFCCTRLGVRVVQYRTPAEILDPISRALVPNVLAQRCIYWGKDWRTEKIQARLKDLGLWTPAAASTADRSQPTWPPLEWQPTWPSLEWQVFPDDGTAGFQRLYFSRL